MSSETARSAGLPDRIVDVAQLEDLLSDPTPGLLEKFSKMNGDLLIQGASGKIGPSLARMARRAFDELGISHKVIAASRFSMHGLETDLRAGGVETIRCDLLDPDSACQKLQTLHF